VSAVARPVGQDRWQTFRRQAPNYLFILPHLLFFLVFLAWPVVFGFWISFHSWEIISPRKPFIGLDNYQELLVDDIFYKSVWNTVRFALFTVAGETVFGLLAALLVNQKFPGRTPVRIILFAPRVLSVATMGIIWQWMMNRDWGFINYALSLVGVDAVNWLDRFWVVPSMAGATVWWVIGFAMIIYLAGLQNIPEHLYEAARIDGAGEWQQFWRITLPLLAPTTLFVVVTSFIAHMQFFGQVLTMTTGAGLQPGGPDYASISVVMYLVDNAFRYYRMGYASAMAFALAAMITIITVVQFRLLNKPVEY
jgi:multiple sugar transport system permease protein